MPNLPSLPESSSGRAVLALGILGVLAGLGYWFGGFEWLELVAVAGTAVGTLGLAFFTYELARSSADAGVETRRLADNSQRQLEAAQDHANSAQRAAIEAARARVDQSSPLVDLQVEQSRVEILKSDWSRKLTGGTPDLLDENREWPQAELEDIRLETWLHFTLTNVGSTPAQVSFPGLDPDPIDLVRRTRGSRTLTLAPGEPYKDRIRFRLRGEQTVEVRHCEIVVTYNGLVTGAMFDTLRWRGQLQLLHLDNGRVLPNQQIPLNAGPAQVVREYPALEYPAQISEAIERFRAGPGQA